MQQKKNNKKVKKFLKNISEENILLYSIIYFKGNLLYYKVSGVKGELFFLKDFGFFNFFNCFKNQWIIMINVDFSILE